MIRSDAEVNGNTNPFKILSQIETKGTTFATHGYENKTQVSVSMKSNSLDICLK